MGFEDCHTISTELSSSYSATVQDVVSLWRFTFSRFLFFLPNNFLEYSSPFFLICRFFFVSWLFTCHLVKGQRFPFASSYLFRYICCWTGRANPSGPGFSRCRYRLFF